MIGDPMKYRVTGVDHERKVVSVLVLVRESAYDPVLAQEAGSGPRGWPTMATAAEPIRRRCSRPSRRPPVSCRTSRCDCTRYWVRAGSDSRWRVSRGDGRLDVS